MTKEIQIDIATAKGIFSGIFSISAKIADVISATIDELKLDGGDSFELIYGDEVLEPNRPIASYKLSDGVSLELVATGSGV